MEVNLPLTLNTCLHTSPLQPMRLLLPLWLQVATSLAQLVGQWLKSMPAGSFAPRVPVESLVPVTIHVTKRQLLRFSRMSLPVPNTFMPRMQRENIPTSTPTSSPNMLVILPRSRIFNVIWRHGICQIPLSFLCSLTLMLYQCKIAGQKGSQRECTY